MDNPAPANAELRSELAKSFVAYMEGAHRDFEFELRGVSADEEDFDIVRLRIFPDIPSDPAADIRNEEDIEIRFDPSNSNELRVRVLREDFPSLAHINPQIDASDPKTICLYEEPWADRRLTWSHFEFFARIFQWFRSAAEGTIHPDDQALEPLFLNSPYQWILPDSVIRKVSAGSSVLEIKAICVRTDRNRLLCRAAAPEEQHAKAMKILCLEAVPAVHGQIRKFPANLEELLQTLGGKRDEFFDVLIDNAKMASPDDEATFMLLVKFLVKRRADALPESEALWAFVFPYNLCRVGEELGIFEDASRFGFKNSVPLVGAPSPGAEKCRGIPLIPVMVVRELTVDRARIFAGVGGGDAKILLIGAGTLGSQIHMNLTRSGWGRWTIVDQDHLLPHNLVRHASGKEGLGWPKALIAAENANRLIEGMHNQHLCCDILNPGEYADELRKACADADIILDCSASVAAARHIAADIKGDARRVSAFIGAGLKSLILLAEDRQRTIPLDWLEMLLYRAALDDEGIASALRNEAVHIPYANSCRDKSVQLPQDVVGAMAGISSMALRSIADDEAAHCLVFKIGSDLCVSRFSLDPTVPETGNVGDWRVFYDAVVMERMNRIRADELPRETGGILVGARDVQRRIIYVVQALEAPPDSDSAPGHFERGTGGLAARLEEIRRRTGGGLEYVGEWHSHPEGCSPEPSQMDLAAVAELKKMAQRTDQPVLMAIAGDSKTFTFTLAR